MGVTHLFIKEGMSAEEVKISTEQGRGGVMQHGSHTNILLTSPKELPQE